MEAASLTRLEWQPKLFAERPRRTDITSLIASWSCRTISLMVWRNWPFELVEALIKPFGQFGDLEFDIQYGEYDDSLAFTNFSNNVDLHLITLDIDRYQDDFVSNEASSWLASRIKDLRSRTDAPIYVALFSLKLNPNLRIIEKSIETTAGIYVCDIQSIIEQLGTESTDERAAVIRATDLSDIAVMEIARKFGLTWIPAIFSTPIKAVAIDLDNTLYSGVLAEDGASNLNQNLWQKALAQTIAHMQKLGVMTALVSKNVEEDVNELLRERPDLVKRSMFTSLNVSWQTKSEMIHSVADEFNIGIESIIFVDDNVGELNEVAIRLPGVKVVAANESASRAVENYPGMFKFGSSSTDALRISDIQSQQERQEIQQRNPDDYIESLEISLDYKVNDKTLIKRAFELLQKTNQFNLSLKRSSESYVSDLIEGTGCVVTFSLSDRLSESGVIGVLCATVGDSLNVHELCISCRALGRGIENEMVMAAINASVRSAAIQKISIDWARGPRNMPALEWLSKYADIELTGEAGIVEIPWDIENITKSLQSKPIKIEIEDAS
jgi:FkbH-like protein